MINFAEDDDSGDNDQKKLSRDHLDKLREQHNKKTKLLISLSVISLTLFAIGSAALPFKDKILDTFYPKAPSKAQTVSYLNYRNWEKISPVVSPPGRHRSALAFFPPTGKLILYGGWGGWEVGQLSDTWEFDGKNWNKLHQYNIGTPIGPLTGHAMVTDDVNNRLVLFGGFHIDGASQIWDRNNTYFFKFYNDWQKQMWELVSTATTPPARHGHAMAYDSSRRVVMMFGGITSSTRTLFNDTWEFDGNNWQQIQTIAAPTPRWTPVMSYDYNRKKIVLHGGYNWDDYHLTDTWEYDSSQKTWFKIAERGIDSDGAGAMAYDPTISRVVLFGGYSASRATLNTTWEYDGTIWRQMFPTQKPLPIDKGSMVFYPNAGTLVLFGGAFFDTQNQKWVYPNDTWIYKTTDPASSPTPTPTASSSATPTSTPTARQLEDVWVGKININTSIQVQDKIQTY